MPHHIKTGQAKPNTKKFLNYSLKSLTLIEHDMRKTFRFKNLHTVEDTQITLLDN